MSDLPNKLVESAGCAVFDEIARWRATPDPFGGRVGTLGATSRDVGRVAAVALLRTLAKAHAPQPHEEGGEVMHFLGYADLRRIADQIEARR